MFIQPTTKEALTVLSSKTKQPKSAKNKLKIAITQFGGNSQEAICKVAIKLSETKEQKIFIIAIDKMFWTYKNPEDACWIAEKRLYSAMQKLITKAQTQLTNEYGISTYWIFHDE